jgi:ABC-2 type transport system ATP-binding protein
MDAAIISIQGLSKSYGSVRALDGLSFEMQPGPVGLLGPNGAGKTTLLKLLLGLLKPDSGSALIAAHDPRTAAGRLAVRRSIGYMPEGDCLIPGTTAVELVSTLARLSGLARDDAMTRAHEVLDYVGLDESRYRDCDGYSTGMKQRLKLAQALVHDPPILLLDEPTNGLDPKGRRHMLELVHDLGHAQQKSLLLCSHLLPDVERCCRDVIVLEKGRIVTQGSIRELTADTGLRVSVRVANVERFRASAGGGWREIVPAGSGHGAPAGADPTAAAGDGSAPNANGEGRLLLQLDSDDCDPVFATAFECGARILAIEPVRSTLEDVFMASIEQRPRGDHAPAGGNGARP